MTGLTLVFLHALGASAREWEQVIDHLPGYECVALDLPGFGGAAKAGHADVVTMTDWLADEIRSRQPNPCVLVGHSMGGKIATILAQRSEAGRLSGLAGVVLMAASPPSPEPIDDERRTTMIDWVKQGPVGIEDARDSVDQNIAAIPDKAAAVAEKPQAIGWFVGQVMKATGGKANPAAVNDILKAKLGL